MPNRYPQEAVLRNGRRLLIRPFATHDVDRLYQFFMSLPTEDRRFSWNHLEDRSLVEAWGQNIDYAKVFPLLALDGTQVVADMTLHRRTAGPLRLVGRIKWLINPAYRGDGLGTLLVNHFIGIARREGLHHLTCMLISGLEADAVRVLHGQGFKAYEFPGYGIDPDGSPHDMTKMVLKL
jgi:GNAT superfamily N-acetyltransferase